MTTKTPLPTIATNLKHFIGTSQRGLQGSEDARSLQAPQGLQGLPTGGKHSPLLTGSGDSSFSEHSPSYYKAFEFPNLYWTDGVQYYVTELNAYELLSIIDYYCGHIMNSHLSLLQEKSPELDNKQLSMLKGIQFWSMEQIDNKFSFSCKADSNYPQLFYHEFTIPLIPQKFFCQRYSQRKWVLMLNTEY